MWPQDQLHRAPVNDFPPLWASSWGDDEYGLWADLTITSNNITATQKMRWIEPSQVGGFLMGSTQKERDSIQDKEIRKWANENESEPIARHVKNGFWLANTPCTQNFWTAVVGKNPSHFKNLDHAANLPVESIAFKDDKNKDASVVHFLKLLNQNLQNISSTQFNQQALSKADLPTEIEWEYACRADTLTAFWWGNDFESKKANTDYLEIKRWDDLAGTSDVSLYAPNPWGLYDMHGNVWEWTSSPWENSILEKNSVDAASRMVQRGGCWRVSPDHARSSDRSYGYLEDEYRYNGFRFRISSSSEDH